VTGHRGTEGDETASQLDVGIHWHVDSVAKWAIREWMNRNHQEYCKSVPGQKHEKGFLGNLPPGELLEINRNQLRNQTGHIQDNVT
jgi:hypothetical protein